MMQSLDQWAFSILMSIYSILGIQDLPRVHDPDWTISEKWTAQENQTYRLNIVSESIPVICRAQPEKQVIFSQTYMGRQEIFSDNTLVYTNRVSGEWNLRSVFDRPSISCRFFMSAQKVSMSVEGYSKYFSSIGYYPYLSDITADSFLYDQIYLVAAAICLCLGIVTFLILKNLGYEQNLKVIVLKNILLSILMITYTVGYIADVHLKYVNLALGITLTATMIFLLQPLFKIITNKTALGSILITSLIWIGFHNYKHMMSLILFVYLIIFSFSIVAGILKMLKRKRGIIYDLTLAQKVTYVFIAFLAIEDIYTSHVSRVGYFHLGFLAIIVATQQFVEVVKKSQKTSMEILSGQQKLEREKILTDNLIEIHNLHKEVIHDIKSPITAIDFLAKDSKNDYLRKVSERFKEILGKYEAGAQQVRSDWYSVEHLRLCVSAIVAEKKLILSDVNIDIIGGNREVFFDPVEFKIIIAELIDNSWKSKKSQVRVNILGRYTAQGFLLEYEDDAGGIKSDILKMLGEKGVTTGGTGLGIFSIIKRINSYGGSIEFANYQKGVKISIILKVKD